MIKRFIILFLLVCCFQNAQSSGLTGQYFIKVRDKAYSMNFDVYYINIDTVFVLQSPSNGTLSVNPSELNYAAQNFSTVDTASIVLSYTYPYDTTNTMYTDTMEFIFETLGKANTQASFYYNPGAMSASFMNYSNSDSTINSFKWSFGDGSFSSAENPVHNYASSGTFNVCLTVKTNVDSSIYCENTTVYDSNYLRATYDFAYYYFPDSGVTIPVLDNDVYYQSASISIVSQGIFGTATVVNSKIYYEPDTFVNYSYDRVKYAISRNGMTDTTEVVIYTYVKSGYAYCSPEFTFSRNNNTLTFTQSSKCGAGNSIQSQLWDFGDSSTSTAKNPSHTYANYGTYLVCLESKDTFGLTLKSCLYVDVSDLRCYPEFGYVSGVLKADFYNMSHCFDAVSYSWDFGDSTTSTNENPTHSYANAGSYTVCLTKIGTSDTLTICKNITVYDTNVVIANDDYAYLQYSLNTVELKVVENDLVFNPSSVSIIGTPSLVDASVANNRVRLKNKRQVFYGQETIAYEVCKGGVCDTANIYITVSPQDLESDCQPTISYSTVNDSIQFTLTPNCPNGDSLISYNWFFGDGYSSTETSPIHFYTSPGFYVVYVTAIDTLGKLAYASEYVTVIDSSVNGGCIKAEDDFYEVNFFSLSNRYNVLFNDKNIFIKNSYTTSIKDFSNGVTYLDTFGNLMWLPDSGYTGCDTMFYTVYNKNNTSCIDTGMVVYCYNNDLTWCSDSSAIDTSFDCGDTYMPVCGCNGVEYRNACEAYTKGGIYFYLNGPCSNFVPGINFSQSSSSQLVMYNDETKSVNYKLSSNDKEVFDIQLMRSFKDLSPSCLELELDKNNNQLVFKPSKGCVGKTVVYATVCDNFGSCQIDTLYVNVIERKQTSVNSVNSSEVKIYPNPFTSTVKIELGSIKEAEISILNLTGQEVYNGVLGNTDQEINLSGLAVGVYIVKVKDNQGNILKIEKLLKD